MQKKRNVLNSPRLLELKKRRQKTSLNKIYISLVGFLVIFIAFVFISHIKSLNIYDIQVEGNKVLDGEMLKNAAREQITGKYFWLFPKTNVLFYPGKTEILFN